MSLYKPIQYTTGKAVELVVRLGLGTITDGIQFSDKVEVVDRVPTFNVGWQSVTYKGRRYQLFGGIRTPFFICLNDPIKVRRRS